MEEATEKEEATKKEEVTKKEETTKKALYRETDIRKMYVFCNINGVDIFFIINLCHSCSCTDPKLLLVWKAHIRFYSKPTSKLFQKISTVLVCPKPRYLLGLWTGEW